jgi:hypothetical protein
VNDDNLDIPDYSLEYKNFTYKHPNFKETDLISILGMDKNEILSNDIILIHTAYLAYNYYNFIYNIINTKNNYFKNTPSDPTINTEKYNDYEFNLNKNLLDYEIISYLESLRKNYEDTNKTKKKRQRLANILYKAINICYDNKSDFSINLINRTKKAFRNYELIINEMIKLKENYNFIITTDNDYYNKLSFFSNVDIFNGFNIEYLKNEQLLNLYDNIKDNEILKNNYRNKFLFYTEEDSEIINKNVCKSGYFIKNKECVRCTTECNNKEKCKNNEYCRIYCETDCKNIERDNEKTKCGGKINIIEDKPLKEKSKEIKTPIEEETYIPNFSYIFKTAIKIFFMLIVIYICYMFYNIFNESILTFLNTFYGFFEWLWYVIIIRDKIKQAEYYFHNIQDKYNRVIRKTMT